MPQESAALLLVDVQQGFQDADFWGGNRNNPQAEENIARLLGYWRDRGRPVIHVRHVSDNTRSPLRPGQPGVEIRPEARPAEGEPLFEKNVNSAFIGTGLEAFLREKGIRDLVIAGITTNHCVSTTARMAGNLGFNTRVVADATACFDRIGHDGRRFDAEAVHAISLANLHGEFATVVQTGELLES
ncbi:MAG: cysteine hydrolase family protein [Gammaproteobacteria bacterium]|jgi:nicotinamidase-related amidase